MCSKDFRCGAGRQLGREHSPHGGSDEIGLRGSRRISWRSRPRAGSGQRPDLESLCGALARGDRPRARRPSAEIKALDPLPYESDQTTHFSIVDNDGNAVANTYTLNFSYGLGLVAEGTGVLLNNELDDFAAKPGAPNAYELVGGAANAPGPRKRPLSSMAPTFVFRDGELELVTGSPGGSRIITIVTEIILDIVDFGMNIAEATEAVRIHHQWLPDELQVERGLTPDTIRLLEALGHTVKVGNTSGSAHSIMAAEGWRARLIRASAGPWSRGIDDRLATRSVAGNFDQLLANRFTSAIPPRPSRRSAVKFRELERDQRAYGFDLKRVSGSHRIVRASQSSPAIEYAARGQRPEEAVAEVSVAMDAWIAAAREAGHPLPAARLQPQHEAAE